MCGEGKGRCVCGEVCVAKCVCGEKQRACAGVMCLCRQWGGRCAGMCASAWEGRERRVRQGRHVWQWGGVVGCAVGECVCYGACAFGKVTAGTQHHNSIRHSGTIQR